jgi:hypothetical protein
LSLKFEWDHKKSKLNFEKHGVSFEEASTILGDPLSLTVYDEVHSDSEDRYITIGQSCHNKIIVVVHADRINNLRIISARLATSNEKKQYREI